MPAAPEGEWIAEEGATRTVGRNNYSLLVCLDSESGIEELMDEYRKGTKLYLLAAAPEIYDRILDCFQGLLRKLNLTFSKGRLQIESAGQPFTVADQFRSKNCHSYTSHNFLVTYPRKNPGENNCGTRWKLLTRRKIIVGHDGNY